MLEHTLERVVLGTVLVVLGCGGSGAGRDGGDPGTGGRGGGAGSGSGGAGTSGTGTGGASSIDPTPFLGTWTETATFLLSGSCSDLLPSITVTDQITVSAGTASDIVRSDGSCSIPLDNVSSTQATLARSTQCSVSSGSYAFESWTVTISGNAGSESASGTLMLTGAGTCPFSMTATLTR